MRKRWPGAIELVYDNDNALAIGFPTTERASDAVFSIASPPVDEGSARAGVIGIDRDAKGRIVIKSVSAKQRPRRPPVRQP